MIPLESGAHSCDLCKGGAPLYDVVGSVKRHFEFTSCGRLVLVLTYKGLCSFLHSDQGSLSKSSGGIWFHQPSIRSLISDHDSLFRLPDFSGRRGAQSAKRWIVLHQGGPRATSHANQLRVIHLATQHPVHAHRQFPGDRHVRHAAATTQPQSLIILP